MPGIGMFIDYGVTKWAILRLRAQSLDLEIGDLEGRFLDAHLGFSY